MKCSDYLKSKNLISSLTDEKILNLLDNNSVTFYIGFDPTADSLHVGHLIQLVAINILKKFGHKPIILLGSATSRVGDPTGKTTMRKLISFEEINKNANLFKDKMIKIVGDDVIFEDNLNWFNNLSYLDFLSNVGKHFSVNKMLTAECYKTRLEEGLTFLEFNYMLMQSYDFLMLNKSYNCILQVGGSDQWSNIIGGIELNRRILGEETFGLTLPLLTNSNGFKMGKTETGAIWLDSNKTSEFQLFQYFRNIVDSDVEKCCLLLTDIDFDPNIDINLSKEKLAFEVVKLVHGYQAANICLDKVNQINSKDFSNLEKISVKKGNLFTVLVSAKIVENNSQSKTLIKQGAIKVNNNIIKDPMFIVDQDLVIITKSKKNYYKLELI